MQTTPNPEQKKLIAESLGLLSGALGLLGVLITILIFALSVFLVKNQPAQPDVAGTAPPAAQVMKAAVPTKVYWAAPAENLIPDGPDGELIRYGKELIAHTSRYLGPKGSVKAMSNGMNCQNCHLDAGTKTFGNNYALVASTYPKLRARSGTEETVEKRVNDCFERSLNGKPLDEKSKEMKAIVAYIQWVGQGISPGTQAPDGAGLAVLPWMDRAADPEKGKKVYELKCQSCHGAEGKGQLASDGLEYIYPPLWGENSYNLSAGLYRLSRMASYVKYNMPLGVTHQAPLLSDEEAWDVAAFINTMPHPDKRFKGDWPDISKKPVDHPFGPFADSFSEEQHKYGPFKPIIAAKK